MEFNKKDFTENLIHLFYDRCELGDHSRGLESKEFKNSLGKMEKIMNCLMDDANDKQKVLIQELSDLCLEIINLTAPYDFENGFCTAIEFFKGIQERNVSVETMINMRLKSRTTFDHFENQD
ncbi:MAG: hypothetical protein ACLROI_14665 [Beduini sp.]|uniref:hypothetical protein n=1 Tax=Beduini sp. TaxID=1922300 RepID=UPI0011C8FDA9